MATLKVMKGTNNMRSQIWMFTLNVEKQKNRMNDDDFKEFVINKAKECLDGKDYRNFKVYEEDFLKTSTG